MTSEATQKEMQPLDDKVGGVSVITGRPPNFEAIAEVFPGAHADYVIFAYGDAIYTPNGQELPPELMAHELVHCRRQQAMGVEAWWDKYLTDGDFRYEEELLAHIAEFKSIMSKYNYQDHAIARVRERALDHVAKKLAAPLYNGMVPVHKARAAIKRGAKS